MVSPVLVWVSKLKVSVMVFPLPPAPGGVGMQVLQLPCDFKVICFFAFLFSYVGLNFSPEDQGVYKYCTLTPSLVCSKTK